MSSESALPFNGPLSTYQEWDSFMYGISVGALLSIDTVRHDIRAEPSKFIGGVLIGVAFAHAWRAVGASKHE